MSPAEAIYVYGIVRRARLPRALAGRGLRLVRSTGGLAAIVSDLSGGPVEATRENLLAHAAVVEDAFACTPVVPMRFGTVLPDDAAVRESVLERNAALLTSLLAAHEETVELTLSAEYDEEAVLAELVAASPRLARLRDDYRREPTMPRGLALGEEVAAVLGGRRERDAARVLDTLAPLAVDVRVGSVLSERGVLSCAFLVQRTRVEELEQRLGELSAELSPPIRFRLVGPLPPYSFVDVPLPVAA